MSSILVSRPLAGDSVVVAFGSQADIALSFDPATAMFAQSGSDLVISFGDGGSVSVQNFFAEDQTLPETFSLADGTRVPIADFMNAFGGGIELMTAAGPSASAAPGSGGSGVGEYADDAGSLIDGVDRLGSLDRLGDFGSEPSRPLVDASSAVFVAAGAGAPTGPEAPTNPESADQTYFMMVGHTANVQAGNIVAHFAPRLFDPGSGTTVALAGQTSDTVNTGNWSLWDNPEPGTGSSCYTFTSATGETMLYNSETGYFGYFPSADNVNPINNALCDENVGYYYDFFTYQIMENGELTTKYGHVLYVNDQFTTTEKALAAIQAGHGSADHADLWSQAESALADISAFDGTDAAAIKTLFANIEATLESLMPSGFGPTVLLQCQLFDLWQFSNDIRAAVEREYFDSISFQSYFQERLSELSDRLAALNQSEYGAPFDAALANLAEALAAPDMIEGSDSLCENYRPDEGGLHFDMEDGSALPLIDYQFDAAGFAAFLDANPNYTTTVGTLPNVTIAGTTGDDTLNVQNLMLEYSNIALGDGDDTLILGGLHSSTIYTDRDLASAEGVEYSGNDSVTINGSIYDSTIDTGDGDDILRLDVSDFHGEWRSYTLTPYDSTFDGGGNSDPNHAPGQVGDILSFTSTDMREWGTFLTDIFSEHQGNIFKNFEALHLDLTNGDGEVLDIDVLLGAALGKQAVGEFQSLIVTGDDMDTLTLNGNNLTSTGTTTLEGMGNTEFTHYEYTTDSGESVNLYLQIALQFG